MWSFDEHRLSQATADPETKGKLLEARESLANALLVFEGLAYMYETSSNYRYIDQAPNRRGAGEAHVSLASIEHHLALLEPKGDSRDEHYAEAMRNLDEADAIYDELTGKRAKRGKANSMKVRGFIKKSQKEFEATNELWDKALKLFRENHDQVAEAEMTKLLADLALEVDRAQVFKRKLAEMQTADNREEEAIKAAFDVFDRDGSGEMDMKEFSLLASELGTFPPLSEKELKEALYQLDREDEDSRISFSEFWMWWVTDVLLEAEDPVVTKRKRKERRAHRGPTDTPTDSGGGAAGAGAE